MEDEIIENEGSKKDPVDSAEIKDETKYIKGIKIDGTTYSLQASSLEAKTDINVSTQVSIKISTPKTRTTISDDGIKSDVPNLCFSELVVKDGYETSIGSNISKSITNELSYDIYMNESYIRIPLYNKLFIGKSTEFIPSPYSSSGKYRLSLDEEHKEFLGEGTYFCGHNYVYFTLSIGSDGYLEDVHELWAGSKVSELYYFSSKDNQYLNFTLDPKNFDPSVSLSYYNEKDYIKCNGYYLVYDTDKNSCLIYTSEGSLKTFTNFDGTEGQYFCNAVFSNGEYGNLIIEGSNTAGSGEKVIKSKESLSLSTVGIEDIIKLVDYFKYGDGKSIGPWK